MSPASIRTHILLLVLAVALPLAAIVAYDIYGETRLVVSHTKAQLRTLASMMVTSTANHVAKGQRILERLAVRPLVRKVDRQACDGALKELHALDLGYSNIVYTDLAGLTVCSAVLAPGGKTVSVGNMPWFRRFLREKRFTVSQPHYGPITGKWVSVLSTPIWNDRHEMVGGIHLPLDLTKIDPHIPVQYLPAGSRYGFFAEDGTLIWRNVDPEGFVGTRPDTEAARRVLEVRDGELESPGGDGVRRFFSVQPVSETGWIAFVGVPVAAVYAEAWQRAAIKAAVSVAIIAALAALAIAIGRRITRPMMALASTARAIHDGDYKVRADPGGPREMATVAAEFNALIDKQHRNEAQLKSFLENSAVVAWLKDEEGRYVFVSDNLLKRFALAREAVIGRTIREIRPDHQLENLQDEEIRQLADGKPVEALEAIRRRDGATSWWLANRFLFLDADGKRFLGGLAVDVTAMKNAETGLRLAASVFSSSFEGIMIADAENLIVDVNPAFTRITGYGRDEIIGQPPRILSSGRQGSEFYQAMWQSLGQRGYWQGEIWNRRKSGEIYAEMMTITAVRDEAGELHHYIGVFSDISQIKTHELELDRIAHYDTLTGAPNRRLLSDRLGQALARAQRGGTFLAVCYLDLDGFKPINDRHGHAVGDRLLIETSERLKKVLRADDTLARLSGDEFALLLTDLAAPEESHVVLDRVLAAVKPAVRIGDITLDVSASIGVAIFPADEGDADALLRHANQAMFRAKEAGKDRYHLFDPEQDRQVQARRGHLLRLGEALRNREFVLHYQPKVDLVSGEVVGAEALIRWQHPERGLLSPAAFLHYLEGSELEIAVGEWVIDTALEQIAAWSGAGLPIKISVNIGADHLLRPGFAASLGLALARRPDVAPRCLELEILETAALADMEQAGRVLDRCRQLGVGFALDDFGTGYSSLTYFRNLPVETLKIDQSFVRDMLHRPGDLSLVESVVRLAQAFDRAVIAEGVETMEHAAVLLGLGCRLAQGYGIARPMAADKLPGWVVDWRAAATWLTLDSHPAQRGNPAATNPTFTD